MPYSEREKEKTYGELAKRMLKLGVIEDVEK